MLRTALENLSNAIARSPQPDGMYLGNRAYVHHLLGQAALAEADFAAALRAPEYGGRKIYDATIEDLAMHPIAEDEAMRALVERTWADYQQATGDDTTAA